jgi:hypothetical protein
LRLQVGLAREHSRTQSAHHVADPRARQDWKHRQYSVQRKIALAQLPPERVGELVSTLLVDPVHNCAQHSRPAFFELPARQGHVADHVFDRAAVAGGHEQQGSIDVLGDIDVDVGVESRKRAHAVDSLTQDHILLSGDLAVRLQDVIEYLVISSCLDGLSHCAAGRGHGLLRWPRNPQRAVDEQHVWVNPLASVAEADRLEEPSSHAMSLE